MTDEDMRLIKKRIEFAESLKKKCKKTIDEIKTAV